MVATKQATKRHKNLWYPENGGSKNLWNAR
jgi:hypothetical protein